MKKRLAILLAILLFVCVFAIPANAGIAGTATAEDTPAACGETATITISVNGCDPVKTGSITITTDKDITVPSGAWSISGTTMANFNASTQKGVFTYSADTEVSGDIFTLTVKVADDAAFGAHELSYTFQFRNNAGETFSTSGTAKLTVTCPHKNTENVAQQPATCNDIGYTAGVYCKDCETYISGHQEIAKTDNHSYGDWTKTSDTQHTHTCSECSKTETENHTWNGGIVTTDPTHFADGEKTYTCTKCGATKTEKVDKVAHTYDQKNTDAKYLASEATCSEKATYFYSCACGEKGTETFESGELAAHTFGAPTYTWDGDKCTAERVCAHDANHKETETVTGIYVKDTDATCTENEKGHYEATFTNAAFAKQTTEKDSVEKESTMIPYIVGDLDGDENVSTKDAIRLLYHIFYGDDDDYAVNQPCDYNGDKTINTQDAIYLLYYVFYPEDYPLSAGSNN